MLRRTFLGWLAALVALPRVAKATMRRRRAAPSATLVRALGEAVLPTELGKGGRDVACAAFGRWMSGYRVGAELLHPYGSPKIAYAGPSPVPAWEGQLAELERAARSRHGAGFAAVNVAQRQALVRSALAEFRGARLDEVAAAPHIALGLLAHFYSSSEATDLCYRAQIGRNKCRPLVHNARRPLPLASP